MSAVDGCGDPWMRRSYSKTIYKTRELGLLAAVVFVAGCSQSNSGGPATPRMGEVVDVITAPATTQQLATDIEAVGTARSNEAVEITSKSSNVIAAIRFREGELVKRGAVLVELDGAEASASLAEAEANVADSERQYARSRELAASKALSASQLDQIEATLKANRARVNAAKARLEDTVIRAGFDGRVGFRRVSVGGLVSPGAVITTLDDSSLIKLDFTVPETFLYALKPGLVVDATTAGLRGEKFKGTVTNLDSRVDPVTRSIAVRAEIPNREGVLRPGMFMVVTLKSDVLPAVMVPEDAIVPEQGRTYVFTVNEGMAVRREVHVGRRRPGEVEIASGLAEGERVVIEGTQNIRQGSKVKDQAQGAATNPSDNSPRDKSTSARPEPAKPVSG
jgi:membrane fusion protein (multidrug efflux system)